MKRPWIVLGEEGRPISLSRASVPSDFEVEQAEAALRAQGFSGWLAELKGDYRVSATRPRLAEIRPLAAPASRFEDASRKFEALRQRERGWFLSQK